MKNEERVLVTGASGFIGDYVAEKLVRDGYTVYAVYNKSMPLFGQPIKCDLLSEDSIKDVLKKISPDFIVHLAAMTDVDLCEVRQDECKRMNVGVTEDICAYSNNAFLVFISTDYVFDGVLGNYSEVDATNPLNYYGKSKLEAERYVLEKDDSCVLRISTPFAITKRKTLFYQHTIQQIIEGKKVRVVDDQFVTSTFVPSLSKVVPQVLIQKSRGIFHVAVDRAVSRFQFMQDLVSAMGLNGNKLGTLSMHDVQWKAKRPANSSMNIQKAINTFRNVDFDYEKSIKTFASDLQTELGV